jgi:hypothetical protein
VPNIEARSRPQPFDFIKVFGLMGGKEAAMKISGDAPQTKGPFARCSDGE